ncbi:MAG TPA: molybdopterin-dependent oxidoreductase [Thermodesulfobacteriota bacterium]|nr:molybdopterin-dependent oxidoreductase [Thermodesulfobacteriota bacterium]
MSDWKKTSCVLCYHNCGLEIKTSGHRIIHVRPDKEHPRTRGYICRKGMRISYYQDHKERLTVPLKKEGDRFVEISWDRAISEIAARLKEILDRHGPRAVAYMGGGGQGCHVEAGFGRTLLSTLGSQYHYSALAQELSGLFWVNGRAYGRQNMHLIPDLDRAENFLAVGWNGYVSNAGVNRARKRIDEFAKDKKKKLIVVDPLLSETAEKADIHLKPRIGTVALLLKSLIAIILQEGWEDRTYIADYTSGFEKIVGWFQDFDVRPSLEVCGLGYEDVKDVARIYAKQRTAIRTDLGVLMDRQSTINSYLETILMAICGRIGTAGGNVFAGHLMPLGPHSDERDQKTWRTVETNIPAIMGYFPPNVVPEEILSGKNDRLRAMIISSSNPLRSYADTLAYEKAFRVLDLVVTVEIVMSETARMSHYVLPAKSAYEKWDASFFSLTFPEVYFQLRHPACDCQGQPLEEGEIYTRLAEALGLIPCIPQTLDDLAQGKRNVFAMELIRFLSQEKRNARMLPFVVAKTLGRKLGSAHLAAVWGLLMMYPQHAGEDLRRAGYDGDPLAGDTLFQKLLEHPEGMVIAKMDPNKNLERLKTPDKRIELHIEELKGWMEEIDAQKEMEALKDNRFPFVLVAGRHFPYTANTIMRNPAWNENKKVCTLLLNKEDAEKLGLDDGAEARVLTEASSVKIPVEISQKVPQGVAVIPHGFGLDYDGETHGVNVNKLTKSTHRDRLTATPLHRYVPCQIERA